MTRHHCELARPEAAIAQLTRFIVRYHTVSVDTEQIPHDSATSTKRRMKAGQKKLKADAPLVQQREKQQSSFRAFPKKYQKQGIKKSSSRWDVWSVNGISKKRKNNPSLLQKAKKSIKRLQVEVAERRGYTKCMKELAMDELQVFASATVEVEAKVNRMKKKIKILSTKNQISNQFIARMLSIFEAEDHPV